MVEEFKERAAREVSPLAGTPNKADEVSTGWTAGGTTRPGYANAASSQKHMNKHKYHNIMWLVTCA